MQSMHIFWNLYFIQNHLEQVILGVTNHLSNIGVYNLE